MLTETQALPKSNCPIASRCFQGKIVDERQQGNVCSDERHQHVLGVATPNTSPVYQA
jgi:hypothetical protein